MNKIKYVVGVSILLSFLISPVFTATNAHASELNNDKQDYYDSITNESSQKDTDDPFYDSILSTIIIPSDSINDFYTPTIPSDKQELGVTAEPIKFEDRAYGLSTKVKYPDFEKGYYSNPNTHPFIKPSEEIVDAYIKKLQECSVYSETDKICKKGKSQYEYVLELDTSSNIAASVDLMSLTQQIKEKEGKQVLIITSNHLTIQGLKGDHVFLFSDHRNLINDYRGNNPLGEKGGSLFEWGIGIGSILLMITSFIFLAPIIRMIYSISPNNINNKKNDDVTE